MDNNIEFEKNLRMDLENETSGLEFRSDIFEDAWGKKEYYITNNVVSKIKVIKRISIIAASFLMISFATTFAVSADARNLAINSVKTIFGIEIQGDGYKVVERSVDTLMDFNFGGTFIDESKKDDAISKLGFEFYLPSSIGEFYNNKFNMLGFTIYDIKYSDIQKQQDKFTKALEDINTFNSLNYFKKWFICGSYTDLENEYCIYASKASDAKPEDSSVSPKNLIKKEIMIESIKCSLIEVPRGHYPQNTSVVIDENGVTRSIANDDFSKQPTDINILNYICWELDGIEYSVMSPNSFKLDTATTFVKEYIKQLKCSTSK